MSEYNLREDLIKIELAIKKDNLDLALEFYKKINQNWEEYKKSIDKEEIINLLKLSEFIEKLLIEKRKKFADRKKLLQIRKAYSKF